ncbi:MAG: hypothetical protein WBV51_06685 [Pseudolabrys sp.]
MRKLATSARQAAAASAQMLKAGSMTCRGSVTISVASATVTVAMKVTITKRAFSPLGALGGDFSTKYVRRIGPSCGSYQSDIAAHWLPEGPGLMVS